MSKEDQEQLKATVRQWLSDNGITQKDFAEMCGLKLTAVQNWFAGKSTSVLKFREQIEQVIYASAETEDTVEEETEEEYEEESVEEETEEEEYSEDEVPEEELTTCQFTLTLYLEEWQMKELLEKAAECDMSVRRYVHNILFQ